MIQTLGRRLKSTCTASCHQLFSLTKAMEFRGVWNDFWMILDVFLPDFMGLGKTMQAALVIKGLHLLKQTTLLVVAPKSLIPHWHSDAWHAEGEDCKRNSLQQDTDNLSNQIYVRNCPGNITSVITMYIQLAPRATYSASFFFQFWTAEQGLFTQNVLQQRGSSWIDIMRPDKFCKQPMRSWLNWNSKGSILIRHQLCQPKTRFVLGCCWAWCCQHFLRS